MGIFTNPKNKEKIKFKPDEIYTCRKCGYHQGMSWDGKMRRCKGCGSFDWE